MAKSYVEIRSGAYRDSVSLLEVSRSVSMAPGVLDAIVAMGTPLNLDLLRELGFDIGAAGTNDLVIAIRADDESGVDAGLGALKDAFAAMDKRAREAGGSGEIAPARSIGRTHGADLALISVPGSGAFAEAMDALEAGQSVMLFSDNVPVWQEIALKDFAASRDLLVMGPDCGTAVIGGIGLGFANVTKPGPVGIIAASGTGAQHMLSLLDLAGVGITHCIGVGGRDLSRAVMARSTLSALDALTEDPQTEVIVLVSKPPAKEVAELVRRRADATGKKVVFAFLGEGAPDLTQAAEEVLRAVGAASPTWPSWGKKERRAKGSYLRGLFSGGTLCDEAMVIAAAELGPIYSNIALRTEWIQNPFDGSRENTFIDFGDDAMTVGRAHPMIDPTFRVERFHKEVADPDCGVILMDVVLGHAADPDPASTLAPVISEATARQLPVVVALIGTTGDPQGLAKQAQALSAAGAYVTTSNAAAVRHAIELIKEGM